MIDPSNAISRAAQDVANRLDQVFSGLARRSVSWILVVYTPPRATYVGSTDAAIRTDLISEVVARWNGKRPRVLLSKPSVLHQAIMASAHDMLDDIQKLLTGIAGKPVAFSIILGDAPNPPIYLGAIKRDDAKRELTDLLAAWKAGLPDIPAHEID